MKKKILKSMLCISVLFSLAIVAGCDNNKYTYKSNTEIKTVQSKKETTTQQSKNKSEKLNNTDKGITKNLAVEYMPNEKVINIYTGDFENEGSVSFYNNFIANKIEKWSIDAGSGSIEVFEKTNEGIVKINTLREVENFHKNHVNDKATEHTVIIKNPIKIGTEWVNISKYDNEKVKNKIIAVDKDVKIHGKVYKALIINRRVVGNNDSGIDYYYAKGKGLIKTSSTYGIELKEQRTSQNDLKNWQNLITLSKNKDI